MTEVLKHEPGTFCWTDLSTTDQKAATQFYTSIFGWEVKEFPIGEGATYTMFSVKGKQVCALYTMMADQKEQGVPPNWLAYVCVANADEATQKVKAAGGHVIEGAFDVMDVGRMSVVKDPTGAIFALWQPKKSIGSQIQEVPGSVCWRELLTQNPSQAGKFYSTVFGWSIDTETFKQNEYTLIKKGDDGVGGMITIPGVPTCWITYWIVEDCEQIALKTKKLGGQIMKEPTKIPGVGTFAVLADPQGAAFAIMQGET